MARIKNAPALKESKNADNHEEGWNMEKIMDDADKEAPKSMKLINQNDVSDAMSADADLERARKERSPMHEDIVEKEGSQSKSKVRRKLN